MFKPNKSQLTALEIFAAENGRCWKSKLRQAWEQAPWNLGAELVQIRNQAGPSWLISFKAR